MASTAPHRAPSCVPSLERRSAEMRSQRRRTASGELSTGSAWPAAAAPTWPRAGLAASGVSVRSITAGSASLAPAREAARACLASGSDVSGLDRLQDLLSCSGWHGGRWTRRRTSIAAAPQQACLPPARSAACRGAALAGQAPCVPSSPPSLSDRPTSGCARAPLQCRETPVYIGVFQLDDGVPSTKRTRGLPSRASAAAAAAGGAASRGVASSSLSSTMKRRLAARGATPSSGLLPPVSGGARAALLCRAAAEAGAGAAGVRARFAPLVGAGSRAPSAVTRGVLPASCVKGGSAASALVALARQGGAQEQHQGRESQKTARATHAPATPRCLRPGT